MFQLSGLCCGKRLARHCSQSYWIKMGVCRGPKDQTSTRMVHTEVLKLKTGGDSRNHGWQPGCPGEDQAMWAIMPWQAGQLRKGSTDPMNPELPKVLNWVVV